MKTPTAIFLGFALIALAHLFQPVISTWLVAPAYGQIPEHSYSRTDLGKVADYLFYINKALKEMKACRG